MKNFIKPKKLSHNDTVVGISLSWGGASVFPYRYEEGKKQLEAEFGLRFIDTPNAKKNADWLFNNPKARADDLHWAFENPDVNAIITSIGGDDTVRLLPYIDFDIIHSNPKIFLGYSDSTINHFMCLKAGVQSFYGPSLMTGFAENGGLHDYTIETFRKTLMSNNPIGEIIPSMEWTNQMLDWSNPDNQNVKRTLTPNQGWNFLQGSGKHSGHLLGGCLESLEIIKGTSLWPEDTLWDGAILFLETSEEMPPVHYFKRCIRNYAESGIIGKLAGIFLGRPALVGDNDDLYQYDIALQEVVMNEYGLNDLPIVTQMDFGHTDPFFILPYMANATIDCDNKTITINDSTVQ